jgi:hypothetical protein
MVGNYKARRWVYLKGHDIQTKFNENQPHREQVDTMDYHMNLMITLELVSKHEVIPAI